MKFHLLSNSDVRNYEDKSKNTKKADSVCTEEGKWDDIRLSANKCHSKWSVSRKSMEKSENRGERERMG